MAVAFAQQPAPLKPSPTPRRRLPKPVVARGFEKFAHRDASDRLIVGSATRPIVDPNDHYARGEAHYRARRYKEAVAELRRAIRLKPDLDEPHYLLALALTELGQLAEALKEFKQVIALAVTDDPKILSYYNMGNAYADLGDYQNAIDSYRQAIKLDPTLSKPHNNLGLAYAGLGRLAEAEAEFADAVRVKPDYAEAHYNLGVAYLQLGRKQDAEKQKKTLVKIKSELAAKLGALIEK
jgi:tetratricopeptide (TPR) repeat protein